MTVCIAAISENVKLVGASDRMITSGDIEFEPPQPKIWQLTASIVAMYSGDTAVLTEILHAVESDVNARLLKDPDTWLAVREVADLYRAHFHAALRKRSESKILQPLGLDMKSYIEKQKGMDSDVVEALTEKLTLYQFDDSPQSVIFAGIDLDGPQPENGRRTHAHIYVARDADITCEDRVGFASIGIGQFHAESHFMFEGHAKSAPFPDTILRTYFAKKRAEVAPGVGAQTDMFAIGPGLGTYFQLGDHVLVELGSIWKESQSEIESATRKAQDRMKQFDEELAKKSQEKNQKTDTKDQGQ